MNFRNLGLAAAAGLLIGVFAASCGTSSGNCTPNNCPTGCCDANKVCQPGTTNESCGVGGLACGVCQPGLTCQGGQCAGGTSNNNNNNNNNTGGDGGTTDGGSTVPDGGSTVPDGGSNLPDSGTNLCTGLTAGCCNNGSPAPGTVATACGNNGQTCATCGTTETCEPVTGGGACQTTGTSGGAVGAACTASTDCSTGLTCATQAPGGLCTKDCTGAPTTCPAGSGCVQVSSTSSLCLAHCPAAGTQSSCRTGYVCDKYLAQGAAMQGVCFFACNSTEECGGLTCESGFCCGDPGYKCCSGGTCSSGSPCGADGYCP